MSIASDLIRGNTDMIILSHLVKRDSYGYEINKSISENTNYELELKEATLYSAFQRLEAAGMITSYWGDQTTGARRRYYTITPAGRGYYEQSVNEWRKAKQLIDRFVQ